MSGDFDGTPFIAGKIVGLRSFQVDKLGRLYATNFPTVWTPGENHAECLKATLSNFYTYYFSTALDASAWAVPKTAKPEPPPVSLVKKPKHRIAGVGCTCGFYAYFDGQDDYRDQYTVSGVVEGYGTVTMGSRGFRASKARIAALIIRARQDRDQGALMARVRHNYPTLPVFQRKAEALTAFPLTPPEMPTPETDPEFWTRSVQ